MLKIIKNPLNAYNIYNNFVGLLRYHESFFT